MSLFLSLVFLLASITSVVAQTFTNCNPLNKTCPPEPALGTHHSWTFNQTLNDKVWNVTNGEIDYTDEGGKFTIAEKLDSPTLQSNFYIFFGIVESHVKMAPGVGVVSSVVLQSADLDEIDWEWVGYNTSGVQTNYYGKGFLDYDNVGHHYIANADTEFHNYTTYWSKEKLEWWLDGSLVRTLNYADADGGKHYPQSPSNVRFGIWPAGDPSNEKGTIEWAGGVVDYDAGPYTMVVKNVNVHDFHSGKEYVYTDNSGAFESIKVVEGNSTIKHELNKPPPKSLSDKWDDLPSAAKIGIYCGAAAAGILAIAAFVIFFLRQRKRGRLEHALDDARWNSEQTEMKNYQTGWRRGGYQPVS